MSDNSMPVANLPGNFTGKVTSNFTGNFTEAAPGSLMVNPIAHPAVRRMQEQVRAAQASGQALCVRGSGSKDWYGHTPQGELLQTRALANVVAYAPAELVVTVQAGMRLQELDALLAEQGQMLPFEPPHFGPDATVGGMLAAGLAGPARPYRGGVRDYLLGVQIMDGQGRVLNFGGQVMKNVAGYDVSRLLAGSMGTLGIVLQVSFKVLPRAVAETTLQFDMDEIRALASLNTWAGQPLPLSASSWHDGCLRVRLSGARAAVAGSRQQLGGQVLDDDQATQHWQALREQGLPFFRLIENGAARASSVPPAPWQLWRLCVPATTPALILAGQQYVEWGGAQRWLMCSDTLPAAQIRQLAAASGGHATLFRGQSTTLPIFHPPAPALLHIQRRLKQVFDPAGILNPGRLGWEPAHAY